jgi:hypothetical protein
VARGAAPSGAEQGVLCGQLVGRGWDDGFEVDGGDAEQVGQGGTGWPCLGNEGGQQEGGCSGVEEVIDACAGLGAGFMGCPTWKWVGPGAASAG